MVTTIKWLPGPDQTPEYSSLAALAASIQSNVFAKVHAAGSLGYGEAGTPPWVGASSAWSYVANSGMPYLQTSWDDALGTNTLQLRLRYSAALAGMLDPFTWYPGLFSVFGTMSYLDLDPWYVRNAGGRVDTHTVNLGQTLAAAGLSRSAINHFSPVKWVYSFGARAGKFYGFSGNGYYNPNTAEQAEGILRSTWTFLILANDADDGTIGAVATPGTMGENYSQVPQLVSVQPDQRSSWGELSDGVLLIPPQVSEAKDAINNQWKTLKDDIPGVDEFWTKIPKSIQYEDPEAVTHPDDQATDPWTPIIAAPPAQAASNPGFLPAVLSVPYALATISKPALVKVGSVMATGVAAAEAYRSGVFSKVANAAQGLLDTVFDKVVDAVDWMTGPTNPPAKIQEALEEANATSSEALVLLERLTEAVERIAVEIVRDPEDPIAHQGIVNAVELASQARSEITLRSHGMMCTASTGVVVEEDPEP